MVVNDAGVIGLTSTARPSPRPQPIVGEEGRLVLIHYFNEGLQGTRCTCTASPSWWWPRTGTRWPSPTGSTPSGSLPASATACWCRPRRSVRGPSTATSSATPRTTRACIGMVTAMVVQ